MIYSLEIELFAPEQHLALHFRRRSGVERLVQKQFTEIAAEIRIYGVKIAIFVMITFSISLSSNSSTKN